MPGLLRSLLILALVPTLNMCAAGDGGGGTASEPTVVTADAPAPAEMKAGAARDESKADEPAVAPAASSRLVIYSGSLRVQVERLDSASIHLRRLVSKLGGYLAGETTENYGSEQRLTFSIRVPARQFDPLVRGAEGIGTYLAEKNLQAQDVTEEFRDNEARLKSRRTAELTLLDILRRARTVDEVLKVQEQLQRIREEIEVVEGRNRYLGDRVAYSTLSVTLYELSTAAQPPQEGFFYKLWTSVKNGWDILKQLILGLVTVWPLLIIAIIAVTWAIRNDRKRKAAREAAYAATAQRTAEKDKTQS
jgi:hypothetical protein